MLTLLPVARKRSFRWPFICVLAVVSIFFVSEAPAQDAVANKSSSRAVSRIDRRHTLSEASRSELARKEALEVRTSTRLQSRPVWRIPSSIESVSVDEQDSLALVALYQSTNGSDWNSNSNWLTGPVSSWEGITTNEAGRVTSVVLPQNDLFGPLPAEIGQLSALEVLDLYDNFLQGSIPSELVDLAYLEILDLSYNVLTGALPEGIEQMTYMTHLILWGNGLSGEIPSSLGQIAGLQELWLFLNEFTGPIPEELGDLTSMTRLYLDQNQLSGSIPVSLAGASSLSELYLDTNELTGVIPPELSTLSDLQVLSLGDNLLEGEIPVELADLQKLKILDLSYNCLTGRIPEALSFIGTLTKLFLSGNELSGEIPSALSSLVNLTYFHAAGNQLTGSLFPSLGVDLINMVNLNVSDNLLDGPLPANIGLLGVLQDLDLSGNQFSGELPAFEMAFDLRRVYLNDNQLTGTITNAFAGLWLIEELDLSNNQFTGEIPPTIIDFQGLRRLILRENAFTGMIPSQIGRLPSLATLDLWRNQFSGPLPPELGDLEALRIADLGSNAFDGEIPEEMGQLTSLFFLLLDDNCLTGAVPASFQNLQNLIGLTIRNNELEDLPDLSSLVALDTIDVSENRFTFEDIEPNVYIAGGAVSYAPQAPVPTIVDPVQGGMRYRVDVGGQANEYQWFRNETPIDGADSDELILGVENASLMDTLQNRITNLIATALTLESTPVRTDAILDHIEVVPDTVTLASGDSVRFAYEGFDQFGNVQYFTASWMATGGEISEDGWYVAGEISGMFEVTVENIDGSVYGSAMVTIEGSIEPVSNESEMPVGRVFTLHGSYPNPFSSQASIAFELPESSTVELRVFDVLGREVIRRSETGMPAGMHTISLDAAEWSSGLYFYRIRAGEVEETRAMVKAAR